MRRRQLLTALAAAPLLAGIPRLFAMPAGSPRLLVVFLRGAYDSNHVLVPYSSDFYYEARPRLAIARPDPDAPDAAVRLDGEWALAPALRESLLPFWQRGQLAFAPFTGTDDLSRSHFQTQDDIESGLPAAQRRGFGSGFLARLAGELNGAAPISFTDDIPLIFRGRENVPNLSLRGSIRPAFNARQSQLLAQMYAGTAQHAAVEEGLALRRQAAETLEQELEREMQEADRGALPANSFEAQAQRIAVMMRDRFRLGFVDVGGWDTHVNQGGTDGAMARNLDRLGRGLARYAQTLGPEWDNSVVLVVSEFGRTFRENGSGGTDHGHGTAYWLMGGGVRGGRMLGEQVAVTADTLHQDRDYPVLNHYRDLLAGVFHDLWGLSPDALSTVLGPVEPMRGAVTA